MNTIRWGILGAGTIARLFAQGLQSLPDARLAAVASRTPSRLQEFSRAFCVPRSYSRYEDLVSDQELDVVYVATTNQVHKEHALLCLNAGKPVLCEKPFTVNADEAREVIAVARQKRLFCMEAMWMRFLPIMAGVREVLDSGVLGEVRMVQADLGFRVPFDKSSRFYSRELGGGAMLDLGVYPLSFAFSVLGAPEKVRSEASLADTGVDEQSAAMLTYRGGRLALISSSLVSILPGEAWVIGTMGRLKIHGPLYRPSQFSLTLNPPIRVAGRTTTRLRAIVKQSQMLRAIVHGARRLAARLPERRPKQAMYPLTGNGYNYEAAETMTCLRQGKTESSVLPLDETLRIMETLDGIRHPWTTAAVRRQRSAECGSGS